MKPKVVTFDAAHTLVDVKWNPAKFALDCATQVGLDLDEPHAVSIYERLLQGRWTHYQQINCTRDHAQCEAFWVDLTRDWLRALGQDTNQTEAITEKANQIMYRKTSPVFQLYPDTMPTLMQLKAEGVRMAVISNWDYSLHRVLKLHEAYDIFEVVIASLEEGVEKPDPWLFHLTLDRMGVGPKDAVHVGDSPLDDIQGARNAGMKAVLIDRSLSHPAPGVISSLFQLREALDWIA